MSDPDELGHTSWDRLFGAGRRPSGFGGCGQAPDQRPVEEYLLQRTTLARARSERQIVDAVAAARTAGIPWAKIGGLFGTSAQAAQQRYGAVVEQA